MPHRNLQQSGGVFQAGHGSTVQIHGGQFVQHNQPQNVHNCHEADDGYKHLQAHVATSAFDSQEHVDAPKCHANTRKAVLDEIMNWIILAVTRIQWILWLNGAAGAGKSAIGRSIVDLCIQRNIPIARFFFFRTDSTRNNIKPLVATLVHQLLQSIPDLEPMIVPRIKSDSLIFTKSVKTQFDFLIFGPLRELQRNSLHLHTLVFLFDGVDECDDKDDQVNLIRIFADFVRSNSISAVAFFASRTEDQISTVFRSAALSSITLTLPLDNKYLPDNDIRVCLDDSFGEIKRTHPFSRLLDDNWPTTSEVQEIVKKSSGQFIYASTVIKFCSMLGLHPEQQLKIVHGLRPRGALTPFAQLDALYRHIFSQVRDLEVTFLILAWMIISTHDSSVEDCMEFLGMQTADIYVALAPLQSVVDCTSGVDIQFLHASLPDFLLNKDRSQEYYINRSAWSTRLSVIAYKFVLLNGDRQHIPEDMYLSEAEATQELQDHVLAYNPADVPNSILLSSNPTMLTNYLSGLQRLDFGDGHGGTVYQQQLNVIVRYLSTQDSAYLDGLAKDHKISDILRQIESESAPMMTGTAEEKDRPDFTEAADEELEESLEATGGRQESPAVNEENPEITKHSSSARKIFRALWKSKDRSRETQEAGMQREDGGTTSVARPKLGLSRLFKK